MSQKCPKAASFMFMKLETYIDDHLVPWLEQRIDDVIAAKLEEAKQSEVTK